MIKLVRQDIEVFFCLIGNIRPAVDPYSLLSDLRRLGRCEAWDYLLLVSEGQSFTQVQGPSGIQVLRSGDRGPAVSALQYFLSLIGQYSFNLPMLNIDGIFGPKTKQAVEDVQKAFGLPVTGVVNNATWFRIYDEYVGIATTSLANANLPLSPSEIENQFLAGQFPGYSLSYGSND